MDYWLSLVGERSVSAVPEKRQVNPQDISSILPNIFILEAEDSGAFRFRLAGTALADARGEDVTGSDFLEMQSEELRQFYSKALASVLDTSCGVAVGRTIVLPDARQLRVLHVALPLLDWDNCPRFVIGATDFLSNRPVWGSSEVAAHVSARMIKCRYLDLGWGLPEKETSPFRKYARGA